MAELLESLFNHVALPSRLPGKQDTRIAQIEQALTDRISEASQALGHLTNKKFRDQWDCLRRSLQACKIVNAGGKVSKTSLLTELRGLERNDLLIVHVTEQNVGLLVRRDTGAQGEIVVFEAFEASPLSDSVLASETALQWDFPGCAVAVPLSEFMDSSFQDSLATFLEQASTESIKRFAARTNKAGSSIFESRGTADPSLITQMLMTLLEVNGYRLSPTLLRKRVRDDVCWTDGAEKPWRRCPFWLVLRVGIQRHLCTQLGEVGRVLYKFLICLVLAHLLDDALGHLTPESLTFLKSKLCRRLVKLEVDKDRASPSSRTVYDYMFTILRPVFSKTVQNATERIEASWSDCKKAMRRPILPIPYLADQRDLYLTLPNSGSYLQQILTTPLYGPSGPARVFQSPNTLRGFAHRYFALSELEEDLERSRTAIEGVETSSHDQCIRLARQIDTYLNTVADAYDTNPEQKSVMLLTVMELWVMMDECAVKSFKLLEKYNTGFPPEILDVLQLSQLQDLIRLQKIQTHLQERRKKCGHTRCTIFDDPAKGCFAERFFDESDKLQRLQQRIETAAELARSVKEQEWQQLSAQYERLAKAIAESSCMFVEDEFLPSRKVHDDKQCTKCFLQRKAWRMRIKVHEHPLPSNPVHAKAAVLEIGCPNSFAAYRDSTWRLLSTLARPKVTESSEPRVLLRQYSELKPFLNNTVCNVSLASTTKSFLGSHYASVRFPVGLDNVCLPNGLKLGYFDSVAKVWPARQAHKPTFAHHCQGTLPASSLFSSLQFSPDFAVDANGPSSYEIVASQSKCPLGLNVHEFMAYQALFSGKHRRWPAILIELGSSNLNFSTEATTVLMSQLALQAGPADQADPLRAVHKVLRDAAFCKRLVDQLSQRLDGISSNWRETHCMEMLVSLILRLASLATQPAILDAAVGLVEKARAVTLQWIGLLRAEIHTATDAETSRRCSKYAFWAALLCRRTFTLHARNDQNLPPTALSHFIECSITLQDNLVDNPTSLPRSLRNALIRDLKVVHRMRFVLRRSVEASPDSLMAAINTVWPQPEGSPPRSSDELEFLPKDWWIQTRVGATQQIAQQTVHYHLLEGHLFVDGRPLGKLPAEFRNSMVLHELFGDQTLLTFPSALPGMTYVLAICMYGHQIHVGFRNGELIVRALANGTVLEFIPREVFIGPSSFDLPASLVDECIHWLDLRTGIMEIRKKPHIWTYKGSNWLINVHTREGIRRTVSLVDPQSPAFQRIARLFDRFEYRKYLTVFQPKTRRLTVELRRLELTFTVNRKNLLESSQLRSEIDPNQDAGTWYGLDSKLVLRDTTNPGLRSIIVPFGSIRYKRRGIHVAVEVMNGGSYGRFTINDVLGRLDCPAEPKLLYLKAQFHAYTSFVLPDPLTGRTGTEESLHCLKSGYCQPWTPLTIGPYRSLMWIAKLTPKRIYYPRDMKVMQQVTWDEQLTATIQHDKFRPIVEEICRKSAQLSIFAAQKVDELPSLERPGDMHLLERSYLRRSLYERPNSELHHSRQTGPELPYDARDRCWTSQGRLNVFESTSLIRNWSSEMPAVPDLAGILETWPTIGGYDRNFDKVLLSDRLSVQLDLEWGSLVKLCYAAEPKDKFKLMFLFAAISFCLDIDMDLVRTLLAFAVLEDLKKLTPPTWPSFVQFRRNQTPHITYLLQLMKGCCVPYPGDERDTFEFSLSAKQRRKFEAAELAHERQVENDCKAVAQFLLEQWPCPEPTLEGFSGAVLVDLAQAMQLIRPEWERLYHNMELSMHIQDVQLVLYQHRSEKKFEPPKVSVETQDVFPTRCRGGEFPLLSRNLLRKTGPDSPGELPTQSTRNDSPHLDRKLHQGLAEISNDQPPLSLPEPTRKQQVRADLPTCREFQELESIINGIMDSQSTVRQQYGRDLTQSLNTLKTLRSTEEQAEASFQPTMLAAEIFKVRQALNQQFGQLCTAFERDDSCIQWLQQGGLWPCITPVTLLEQLRSTAGCVFGDRMKEALVTYATSITALQRLIRLKDAHEKGNAQRLAEERKNVGHSNWQPRNHLDWLLLEIDANILIRPEQVDVALATISPASESNSVLQMNMGQGKTSCIMPMVAAVLADTKRLHRVVVPKALLLQTAQLLQARLGGLLGREVRHVPFSRKTPTDSDTIKEFHNIHREMLKASGLMIALPEHILSFMLSGLQRLSDGRIPEANQTMKVYAWMRNTCRDVLDECDVTLAVRTQLIYPSGSQITVDGHPHRWQIAEALLELVGGHLWNLQTEFPQSIEVVRKDGGGFPVVFFLRTDVEDALIVRLVNDICNGQISVIPTRECTKSDRLAIKQFISGAKVRQGIAERISRMFPDKLAAKQSLYLLRGLLVHRILLLTLKRRWNVQYGLHPNRDPIAVPFHAKGVPSEQAEWGHPDVAILFTCLAFYYGGLLVAQLRQSLEHLLKSDDPSNEYDRWVNSAKALPGALQDWNAINVDDEAQLIEIWKHVRYDVVVIDYFLNNFVFPKHAKQFQMKLQASGWDIPLLPPADKTPLRPQTSKGIGRGSQALTTGFSGTNDNRTMLPLTIKQQDLPRLSHTNAEVLTYLLKSQSRQYVLVADGHGRRMSELDLLKGITNMGIRILIDAGAQILEMDNLSLVKAWLDVRYEAPAAIFFDNENKAIVRYRHGLQVPLLASPFADNLDGCLVYLDEAHTRGTDLKLPMNARGALTLGLGQTKDQTVQAAMRLRQLATTQSVCFFAPPEVHQSILDLCKKKSGDPVDSYDVIRWLLEQTCDGIEQLQPLYFSQGADFCRRTEATSENPDSLVDKDQRDAYLNALRQVEKQTLEQLYKPKTLAKPTKRINPSSPETAAYMKELNTRRKAFQDTGGAVHGSALQEVEQEREVAHEVEAVREVQKPVHYSALSFPGLHRDIASFVQTGRLAAGSAGYEQAFATLRRTALGIKNGISGEATASRLYVSSEFTKTIKLTQHRPNDNFLRPVNWILWSSVTETAILVIPEEAELIIPLVYQNQKSPTHLLTYSAPVTRKMLHFNSLDYYAMPGLPADWQAPMWLKIELGIFAGRLYFEYNEYDELRKFLGLHDAAALPGETTADAAAPAELDGTNEPVDDAVDEKETDAAAGQLQSFTNKPLSFLQEWLAVRRKGQEFVHTPMGYVCQGKSLTEKHPFFSRVTDDGPARSAAVGMAKDQGKEVTDTCSVAEDDSFDEDMVGGDADCDEGEHEDVIFDQDDSYDNGDLYDEE